MRPWCRTCRSTKRERCGLFSGRRCVHRPVGTAAAGIKPFGCSTRQCCSPTPTGPKRSASRSNGLRSSAATLPRVTLTACCGCLAASTAKPSMGRRGTSFVSSGATWGCVTRLATWPRLCPMHRRRRRQSRGGCSCPPISPPSWGTSQTCPPCRSTQQSTHTTPTQTCAPYCWSLATPTPAAGA